MTIHTRFNIGDRIIADRPASKYWTALSETFTVGAIQIHTLPEHKVLIEYRSMPTNDAGKKGTWFAEGWCQPV